MFHLRPHPRPRAAMTIMMIVRDVAVEVVNVLPDVAEVEIVREEEEVGEVVVGIAPEEDEAGIVEIIETIEGEMVVVEDDVAVVVIDIAVKFLNITTSIYKHASTKTLPYRSPALIKLLLILPPVSGGK